MDRDFKKFYFKGLKPTKHFFWIGYVIVGSILFQNIVFIFVYFIVLNIMALKRLHKDAKENDRLYK